MNRIGIDPNRIRRSSEIREEQDDSARAAVPVAGGFVVFVFLLYFIMRYAIGWLQ